MPLISSPSEHAARVAALDRAAGIKRPQFPLPDRSLGAKRDRFYELIGYEPYDPWQTQFHWACDRFRFVHAGSGARAGKSAMTGAGEAPYRTVLFPGHQTWFVGETYDATRKEFEYAYEAIWKLTEVVPDFKHMIAKAVNSPKQGDMEIRLRHPHNAWIRCRSADNLNSLLSEELDLIVLCEGSQIPQQAWDTRLNQRISSRMGQVIAPTTAAGFTWMHEEFFVPAITDIAPVGLGYSAIAGYSHTAPSDWYRRQEAAVRAGWASSYYTEVFPAYDSPYYPPEEADRHLAKAEQSKDWSTFQEQVLGLFVQKSGLVLSKMQDGLIDTARAQRDFGFSPDGVPPADWPRMAVMDYGESTPKSTTLWAIHPRYACAVIYDEWYETGKLIRDQVHAAKEKLGDYHADSRVTVWIVDRAAPIPEYVEAGAPVMPSMNIPNSRQDMIATANRLLAMGRLFVLRERTSHLQHEAARLIWKPDPVRPFQGQRDQVVKKDDHLCDTVFYGSIYLAMQLIGDFALPQDDPARQLPGWGQMPSPADLRRPDRGPQTDGDIAEYIDRLIQAC